LDIIDEAFVDTTPDLVWQAIIAELGGAASFWATNNTFSSNRPADEIGAEVVWTVHPKGVGKAGPKLRFTSRTVAVQPGRRLDMELFGGVFRGSATFIVEPVNGGLATRISLHFKTTPHGWVKMLAKVANVGLKHSRTTQAAFANLDNLLGGRHRANGVTR
jgi:hypothetical protein